MNDQHPPRRRPFQFRLRTLFVVTTAAAIILAGLSAPSERVRVLSAGSLILAIPVVLTTVLVYGRGYARTFCIGGLFPAGCIVLWSLAGSLLGNTLEFFDLHSNLGEQAAELVVWLALDLLLTIAMGLLAMGVRWLVESSNRAETQ